MSRGIKESVELLRATSAVLVEYLDAIKDGRFGPFDKLKFIGLYSVIAQGLKGASEIGGELKNMDPTDKDVLIAEIKATLLRTGRFTHREADIAERVLSLAYYNLREITELLALPPSAVLAEPDS